ncbi:MAG: hypothetical protein PHR83_10935 [Paludibacter sp.]|nr:hypothetical protein [Paludibacter sp.]
MEQTITAGEQSFTPMAQKIARNEQTSPPEEQKTTKLSITCLKLVELGMLSVKIKGYICGEKINISVSINP